jgi:hypothetical protein
VQNIEWVAGLLEGEGSFYSVKPKQTVRIACSMTDLDVLEKLQSLTGCGSIFKLTKRQSHWKDAWNWTITGRQAVELMRELLPYMGARRSERIRELLAYWENRVDGRITQPEMISEAVAEYMDGKGSLRALSRKYHIGKDTLNKYVRLAQVTI